MTGEQFPAPNELPLDKDSLATATTRDISDPNLTPEDINPILAASFKNPELITADPDAHDTVDEDDKIDIAGIPPNPPNKIRRAIAYLDLLRSIRGEPPYVELKDGMNYDAQGEDQ
jgi:hypothetical protein